MLSGCSIALRRRTILFPLSLPSLSCTTSSTAEDDTILKTEKRSGPPPIRVALTESAGRGVFATRRIGAGELIHTAKPLVAHPSPSLSHRVCYYCLRKLGREALPGGDGTATSTSDAGCYFCSESCREQSKVFYEVERKADWSLYDDHCRKNYEIAFLITLAIKEPQY